jgi:3-hydroxyacyl-[acyl-carrier-protein] dehydratase
MPQTPQLPIDIQSIMKMLPHRYPILLVDKVVEMEPDAWAVGIKNVTINEPFFEGHFPGHPVMPGVLIVEAMAQTAAVMAVATMGEAFQGKVIYFMSIENAKFRRPVTPGDQLRMRVEKEKSRGGIWRFRGEATVDGKPVADATFSAMIVDRA